MVLESDGPLCKLDPIGHEFELFLSDLNLIIDSGD